LVEAINSYAINIFSFFYKFNFGKLEMVI